MKQLFFVERGLGGWLTKGCTSWCFIQLFHSISNFFFAFFCSFPKMSDKKMGISLYFPSELLPNMIGRGLILFCSQYCCLLIALFTMPSKQIGQVGSWGTYWGSQKEEPLALQGSSPPGLSQRSNGWETRMVEDVKKKRRWKWRKQMKRGQRRGSGNWGCIYTKKEKNLGTTSGANLAWLRHDLKNIPCHLITPKRLQILSKTPCNIATSH